MTAIYDLDGTLRDAAWLKAYYGAVLAPCGATGVHFELVEVRVQEGSAVVTVEVRDADNRPLAGYAVALSWPDAPVDLTTPEAAVFKTVFKPRAVIQWTASPNGDTGFGTGTGAYIRGPISEGGPYAAWVLSDKYASDALDRMGQLGGTNHRGPNKVVLRLTQDGPSEPPDGLPPTGDVIAELHAIAETLRKLAQHLGAI